MKLYGYYRSSTSYRIRIALNLKGLDYTQSPVNLRTGEQQQEAFYALNAHKTLPVLALDDRNLVQSLAILDWLEAEYPQPAFLPKQPASAQRCREFYYAIATETHAPNNLPVLNYLKQEFAASQTAIEKWCATWMQRTFSPIEERLKSFQWESDELPFGAPSLFEIVLVPQMYNARRWQLDLRPFPLLTKIDAYCASLPAFDQAHPDKQIDANKETP